MLFDNRYKHLYAKLNNLGIIIPNIFYKNLEISMYEGYIGPRVHKFEKIKIIFDISNVSLLIKCTRVNSLFAIKYFDSIQYFFINSSVKNIYVNDEIIYSFETEKLNFNCLDGFFTDIFINKLLFSNFTIFTLKVDFFNNKSSLDIFLYIKQLIVVTNHSLVLDDENYTIESDRWEKIENGELSETDEEVLD